jgi:hypothetical protein
MQVDGGCACVGVNCEGGQQRHFYTAKSLVAQGAIHLCFSSNNAQIAWKAPVFQFQQAT